MDKKITSRIGCKLSPVREVILYYLDVYSCLHFLVIAYDEEELRAGAKQIDSNGGEYQP